jgi:solute carrier family 66, member 2
MLTGVCSVFYYPGAKYDASLLIQALLMIVMQLMLLKVALDHRPSSSRGGEASIPFAASREGDLGIQRPYNFWQWRSHRPYVLPYLASNAD